MVETIAKKIATRLKEHGYQALYAGGWVRDQELGRTYKESPKCDIDIATDATPDQVAALFSKAILVGAQFGVIRVIEEGIEFEIATFRHDIDYEDGRSPVSVELIRSAREDALRRDFTINGMFFDPFAEKVIDYVQGKEDLQRRLIRTIGKPEERFKEDRLRMVRAIRFATTLDFKIEESTWQAISTYAHTLRPAVSPERLWQELQKIYKNQNPQKLTKALILFSQSNLLNEIFPHLKTVSSTEISNRIKTIERCPSQTPLSALIALLIEENDSTTKEKCIASFHVSRREVEIALFEETLEKALKIQGDDAFWANLYAHPDCTHILPAALSRIYGNECSLLFEEHLKKMTELEYWIEKIRTKKPIVCAQDLINIGFRPGKEFGIILKKLENLAITSRIKTKDSLLEKAKEEKLL